MPSPTEAVRRLEAALRRLEAAAEARIAQGGRSAPDLAAEVQMLSADRVRLAESLDQSEARAAKLDMINRDVSRRLGAAMESIRSVLNAEEDRR